MISGARAGPTAFAAHGVELPSDPPVERHQAPPDVLALFRRPETGLEQETQCVCDGARGVVIHGREPQRCVRLASVTSVHRGPGM